MRDVHESFTEDETWPCTDGFLRWATGPKNLRPAPKRFDGANRDSDESIIMHGCAERESGVRLFIGDLGARDRWHPTRSPNSKGIGKDKQTGCRLALGFRV